jgi:predicted alpha/beta superfamily hydrolase
MRLRVALLPLIASSIALATDSALAQTKTGPYPAVTIPNTEVRSLHSTTNGRDYDLYVYLPSPLKPGVKYPVLYLLDAQWDFKLLTSIQGGLLYDKWVPDVIVVGITYSGAHANYDSLRAVDYTPMASPSNPGSGDGARFLRMLKTELLPFAESNYPIDPAKRALMGASLGGLFTLYAMMTEPRLFAGYAAGSPAVTYADRSAFATEASYAKAARDLPAKLYVEVGDQEPLYGPVEEFVKTLRGRGYKSLVLESRVVQGERHSGNKPEGFNRGLRFLFHEK